MKRKAIIIDLDGTLAHDPNACNYHWTNPQAVDWAQWHKQRLSLPHNQWCFDIVKHFHKAGYEIIYLTGRGEDCGGRNLAIQWLQEHSPTQDYVLLMRPENVLERDASLKEKIYNTHILPTYDVLFAIDDKKDVCEMWEKINVPYLYCGDMHIVTMLEN
jgi:predicted secreted acid phosphatase